MLPFDQKKLLRQHYRHLRRQISPEQKNISAELIAHCFLKNFSFSQKNIAVYWAHEGEVDLHPLVEKLWQQACAVFLPVIHPQAQQLSFARYHASTVMKKNQYRIDEPESSGEFISPEKLDIVLMPLVAFDNAGARLGMGKGYYDKTFAFCRDAHKKPMLVGVAYQCQYCETLPVDEWDVPLDGIMTEKKLILLNENL